VQVIESKKTRERKFIALNNQSEPFSIFPSGILTSISADFSLQKGCIF